MSTKIYNGYRIEANSLDEVIYSLNSIRLAANEEALKYTLQKTIFRAVDIYDSVLIQDIIFKENDINDSSEDDENKKFVPNLKKSALVNAHSKQLQKMWGKKSHLEDDTYLEINIVVFPEAVEIDGKKNYLICLYAERELENWITSNWSSKGIKEYGYWNNTDEPEDVTQEQWDLRESHWNKVLTGKGKTGIPAVEGVTLTLVKFNQYYYDLTSEKCSKLLSGVLEKNMDKLSLDKRLREHIENFMLSTIMNRLLKDKGISPNPEKVTNEIVQESLECYQEARSIIRNKTYSQEEINLFESTTAQLESRLRPSIVLEDLNIPLENALEKIKHIKNLDKPAHKIK